MIDSKTNVTSFPKEVKACSKLMNPPSLIRPDNLHMWSINRVEAERNEIGKKLEQLTKNLHEMEDLQNDAEPDTTPELSEHDLDDDSEVDVKVDIEDQRRNSNVSLLTQSSVERNEMAEALSKMMNMEQERS